MSGLLERIARRRRASASRRLGPGARDGRFTFDGNGAAPEVVVAPEPVAAAPEPVAPAPEPVAPALTAQPPPEAESELGPEPERAPEPEPPPEPAAPSQQTLPGFVERARIRRRARYLRQLRELQLRDVGGLLLEARRRGHERQDLVEDKLSAALETDRELRGLEEHPVAAELRAAGIGGACAHCGAIYGSSDKFCSSCGKPV